MAARLYPRRRPPRRRPHDGPPEPGYRRPGHARAVAHNHREVSMSTEPREFHEPGKISTWFKRLLSPRPSGPPLPPAPIDRCAIIAAIAAARAAWAEQQPQRARPIEDARVR